MKKLMFMLWTACMFCLPHQAAATGHLRVVATLSTFGDLVRQIGGEHVQVHVVASPRFNPHFIQPRPSDVLKTSKADLFVHGGLDLELWRLPLVDAAANRKLLPGGQGDVDLAKGIPLLEIPTQPLSRVQGDIHAYGNPHYWLDPRNGAIMARTVAQRLITADPVHREAYEKNLSRFLSKLEEKIEGWKLQTARVKGKEALAYHNEWSYLAAFTGIRIREFLEPKPGIPPTPRHLAHLEKHIQEHGIKVLFQPTFYSKDAAKALEKRTGIKTYLLCQNVGEWTGTEDYFSFFDYNIAVIARAWGGAS